MRSCLSIVLALGILGGMPRPSAAAEADPLHEFFVGERDAGALFLNLSLIHI